MIELKSRLRVSDSLREFIGVQLVLVGWVAKCDWSTTLQGGRVQVFCIEKTSRLLKWFILFFFNKTPNAC